MGGDIFLFTISAFVEVPLRSSIQYTFESAGICVASPSPCGPCARPPGPNLIKLPACVENAINHYRANNDWLGTFLDECYELDPSYKQKSGEFYQEYRAYYLRTGEYTRSTTDFYTALEIFGLSRKRLSTGVFINGVRHKKYRFY